MHFSRLGFFASLWWHALLAACGFYRKKRYHSCQFWGEGIIRAETMKDVASAVACLGGDRGRRRAVVGVAEQWVHLRVLFFTDFILLQVF